MMKKFTVRRVHSLQLTAKLAEFATTHSVDGHRVMLETQFVGTRLRVDTTQVSYVGVPSSYWSCWRERVDFDVKPPLGASLLIFPRGYFPKTSTRVYFS